ncbi:MAG TPA: SDR family NAD(P)-dependent oxidoreductase [Candidatus Paceibacterota bacterium]|nr:SDR family NAD(P)-dependent oxidoreductase [Candidatus Paceibacterota bacterium]
MKLTSVTGKTIIVVGASGGIGSVCARVFAEAGARLVLSARTESKLTALAETLPTKDVLVVPADAGKAEDVAQLFEKAGKHFGTVDGVLITAGSWKQLGIDDPVPDAVALAESHFRGLFLPTLVVADTAQQFFRKQGHGLIMNISSHAAVRTDLPGNLTYGPMKSAARHFMVSLVPELVRTGVRVTDIQPAIVNTPDAAALLDTPEKRAQAVQPEAIPEWIIENFDHPAIATEKRFDSKVVL